LPERQFVVQPLHVLKTGFWDVAKINLPKLLLQDARLLKLRNLASLAESCNEQIRSRENYRIHNGAMTNLTHNMRLYDEPLVQQLVALKAAIQEYEELDKNALAG